MSEWATAIWLGLLLVGIGAPAAPAPWLLLRSGAALGQPGTADACPPLEVCDPVVDDDDVEDRDVEDEDACDGCDPDEDDDEVDES